MNRSLLSELFLDLFRILLFQLYIILYKSVHYPQPLRTVMYVYTVVFLILFYMSLIVPAAKPDKAAA